MDLLKKFLNSESVSSPITFPQAEVTKHEKELTTLLKLGIVKKRAALTFPCGNCGTYCEIKQSEGGECFIFCDSCEDARLETLDDDQRAEYVFSLPDLLSIFLKDLGYPTDRINSLFQNRLWSLGTHNINDTQREILFVRNPNDAEMDIFQVLQQKQPFHPLVFSTISQRHPLGITFAIVPLENLHRRGQTNKNKWYSRNELATAFGVQEKSISNAMTDIRKIATRISTILIEQHAKNKTYRINPDLL